MTMHFKNLKDMKIVCTSVGEGTKLVDGYKGLRKEIKDILGELPAVDSKIFAVTSGPLSFLQGIPDIITEVIRMVFLLDLLFYSKKFKVIKQYKQDILEVYKVIGYFDAINSIIMYRNRLKYYSEPYFSDNKKINYKCTSMYHPLLTEPVSNSVDLKKSVILTGSNASGKSTFLKTAAINTILSQSLLTSLSKKYEAGFYIVITSIALNDSIKDGESYFIAEIKSLKRVLGKLNKEIPVLCIVDEILRGTNTTERISASAQVLLSFAKNNSLTIAATHDHELCTILSKHFDNYHFEEKIEDNNVTFDYLMKKGPSESKNAIKLLEIYEYGSNIIKESNRMYTDFLKTGKWEIL
jgi:DNA mismatch repair ATPase MutS